MGVYTFKTHGSDFPYWSLW